MGDVNATNVPHQMAVALGTSDFVGGLVASLIFLCLCMFPTLFFCSRFGKDPMLPSIFIGMASLMVVTGLGWMPIWTLIVIALISAFLFASLMRDTLTGRGGGS